MKELLDFSVRPMGIGNYYGFEINKDNLYRTSDGIVHHNSGKSVLEQSVNF